MGYTVYRLVHCIQHHSRSGLETGAGPTNSISTEFKIQFAVLLLKMCSTVHTTILHTSRYEGITVGTCAKFRCDRSSMLWTRSLQIFIEFEFDQNIVSGTGAWPLIGRSCGCPCCTKCLVAQLPKRQTIWCHMYSSSASPVSSPIWAEVDNRTFMLVEAAIIATHTMAKYHLHV